jgi:hypothetical protein
MSFHTASVDCRQLADFVSVRPTAAIRAASAIPSEAVIAAQKRIDEPVQRNILLGPAEQQQSAIVPCRGA